MKPILAILCLSAFGAFAQAPPLPPEPVQAPRGHKSMADAENEAVRLRAAKSRAAQEQTAYFNHPPQTSLTNQAAVQRVRDEVARQKLHPVKPAPMTKHPGLKPPTRSPRDK